MNEPNTATAPAPLSLKQACFLLSDPTRCLLLRELSGGEIMPVSEMARRMGRTRDSLARHVAAMLKLGIVQPAYARMYVLAPAYRPAPGTNTMALGPFVLRLDTLSA